ncbi:MAG: tRNA (adenosine(37)-N6)-dimethylallyltransferase MiaA [bacterium (Candidatus Stahlbacteria) CG08_land_8_20_14_0_20_40_26]|nr:MAG: tRNA (adenosine(37)-N6)-dimethylallyltransferase MiaA [bacterium (Candidatus Stahlbacteria) CG23_combo_of_CG06-09_8_20_14_all_40_9]PIS23626.1 MAG: tRNA (adenosine(37)-N6)-dimethylallyltransferase MiaA [bacterium (Candidatus Stahlbacteria) CG08_land_8_20_14_0_20_40_26]
MEEMRTIIAVVGPTGAGKTEMGFKIALKHNASIVSCDARQVYRFMDIGTAKPDKEMQSIVPHYMIDMVNPDEIYTAYDYARDGRKVIEKLKKPIIIGGSGLYLRALADGLFSLPKIDSAIKERLSLKRIEELYNELKKVDYEIAVKLHPNDRVRIMRAVEVYEATGTPISVWRREKEPANFSVAYIGVEIDRKKLYRRIEERVDSMITRGLVDEVKLLIGRYGETVIALSSIGYSEIVSCLKGDISLSDAINLIKRNTKRYARRQLTWFRNIKNIVWLPPDKIEETVHYALF